MNVHAMKLAAIRAVRHICAGPLRSRGLFKLARMYANTYLGDDDQDMRTNGECRVMNRLLPQCTLAFDVGANIGLWTQRALRVNPKLAVHCFEPTPSIYRRLTANQFPSQVHCVPVALSSSAGTAELLDFGADSTINRMHSGTSGEATDASATRIAVTVEMLDAYCAREEITDIHFLKIDVEGHELQVLRGGEELIRRGRISAIQFEYGAGYLDADARLSDVYQILGRSGYVLFKITAAGLVELRAYDRNHEHFVLSNWLAVHPSHPLMATVRRDICA